MDTNTLLDRFLKHYSAVEGCYAFSRFVHLLNAYENTSTGCAAFLVNELRDSPITSASLSDLAVELLGFERDQALGFITEGVGKLYAVAMLTVDTKDMTRLVVTGEFDLAVAETLQSAKVFASQALSTLTDVQRPHDITTWPKLNKPFP